jgi:hypothetical protein
MSNADQKDGVAPVESSRFGKRFGRTIAIALILIAALVAIATFSGGNQPAPETTPSSNPFK